MSAPSAELSSFVHDEFQKANEQIESGKLNEGILSYERLADRGYHHPDIAYNRGLAYFRRGASPRAEAGDFGQAAAAFAEASSLDPQDGAAARGFEAVTLELARRRGQSNNEVLLPSEPPLDRALSSLSPWLFFGIAALGSLLVCVAIGAALRKHTAATAFGLVGGALLLLGGGLGALQSYTVGRAEYAVVIAGRAELKDRQGKAIRGLPAVPEGAKVRALDSERHLTRVRVEQGEFWLDGSRLRRLPQVQ